MASTESADIATAHAAIATATDLFKKFQAIAIVDAEAADNAKRTATKAANVVANILAEFECNDPKYEKAYYGKKLSKMIKDREEAMCNYDKAVLRYDAKTNIAEIASEKARLSMVVAIRSGCNVVDAILDLNNLVLNEGMETILDYLLA